MDNIFVIHLHLIKITKFIDLDNLELHVYDIGMLATPHMYVAIHLFHKLWK